MSLPDEATSTNATSSSRSKRPFSNALSSILKTKGSHINSFAVELDDPIRKYGPGETVQGQVILDVARPLGVTHIVVSLSGYAQVFKNHSRSNSNQIQSPNRVATGRGKRWVSEYYGDGFMSLFEEEVVLCGEGRLDPKFSPFHFQFNLEFPAHLALPSNIDFDKGTISYLITSTITRPAYTTPTVSCQAKVRFVEDIDVALLPTPKLRAVTLRPEQPNGSPKGNLKRLTSFEAKRTQRASSLSTTIPSNKSVQSQQDLSSIRRTSGSVPSTGSSSSRERRRRRSEVPSEPRSTNTTLSLNGEYHHRALRNITVSAELCRGGCLPGHTLPLLLKIQHNKVVHNSAGILITLYRQARVDMHPHLPLASSENRTGSKYEDYYPRSRSGLGGLSLSAAGSSQVWRKDLWQNTAPLYIDPQTMFQEIKVSVHIPELPEAFPSIRHVPGQMISFRYMVEVIIDIHGKTIGQHPTSVASGAMTTAQPLQPANGYSLLGESGDRTQAKTIDANFLDTTRLRRDKNAITVECELIVGTRDSHRDKGKQKRQDADSNASTTQTMPDEVDSALATPVESYSIEHADYYYEQDAQWEPRWDEQGHRWLYVDQWGHIYDDDWNFVGYDQAYEEQDQELPGFNEGPELIPPPSFSAQLSEKDRLRQAEETLYPSRPPDADEGEGYVDPQQQQATAPLLSEENYGGSPTTSTTHPPSSTPDLPRQMSSTTSQHFVSSPPSQGMTQPHPAPTRQFIPANHPLPLEGSETPLDSVATHGLEIMPTAPTEENIALTSDSQEGVERSQSQNGADALELVSQSEK